MSIENNGTYDPLSLQSFIDDSTDLIWSISADYSLLHSNKAFDEHFEHKLGRPPAGGEDVLVYCPSYQYFYAQALSGKHVREIEYIQDPAVSWSEILLVPIRDGRKVIGVSCSVRNITDIKLEENRLLLFESVMSHTPESILITEANDNNRTGPKIVYVNEALLKLTGYEKEEMIGKPAAILLGPKSDKRQLTSLRNNFKNPSQFHVEIINYKKNGEQFWMHTSIAPVLDTEGKHTHFIAIGRDVTERRRNIQFITEQNLKLREIGHIQSHEVRGPLARIKGLVHLLSNHSSATKDEQVGELIKYLDQAATELDGVIGTIVLKATNESQEK